MKHDFQLDEDGKIDLNTTEGDRHDGPRCLRCGAGWCSRCEPGRLDEDCEGADLTTHVSVTVSWPGKGERYTDRQRISAEVQLQPEQLYPPGILDLVEDALRELPGQVLAQWWTREVDRVAGPGGR